MTPFFRDDGDEIGGEAFSDIMIDADLKGASAGDNRVRMVFDPT